MKARVFAPRCLTGRESTGDSLAERRNALDVITGKNHREELDWRNTKRSARRTETLLFATKIKVKSENNINYMYIYKKKRRETKRSESYVQKDRKNILSRLPAPTDCAMGDLDIYNIYIFIYNICNMYYIIYLDLCSELRLEHIFV